jgi:hypothetical protein
MVKVKSKVFNNLTRYLESMRTCKVSVDDLVENSEMCCKGSDKEEGKVMGRMNGLVG